MVPEALVEAPCFAFDSSISAACQQRVNFDPSVTASTFRGNFVGGYPPAYYAVMNVLAGPDIVASAIGMRLFNVLLFVGLTSALWALLPAARRGTLVWMWALTTVPLGMFVLASNNPSAWAVMGVGSAWIALLGYFESTGWRRVVLGLIFALAAMMAAGARADGALYSVAAIAAVVVLTVRWKRSYLLQALLPAVVAAACVALFRFSRPIEAVTAGVTGGGGSSESVETNLSREIAGNLLEVPRLWTGVFGKQWGLGWLDTSMPALVWAGALVCFLGVGFLAVRHLSIRQVLVLSGGVLVLWLLPTAVLVGAGDGVGENMQPRYLLPLVVLFAGVLLLRQGGTAALSLSRLHRMAVVALLSFSFAIALHLNMQRYIFGFDNLGWNLNAGIEWWWNIPISPMVVWLIGSASFAGLLLVVLPAHLKAPSPQPAPAVATRGPL